MVWFGGSVYRHTADVLKYPVVCNAMPAWQVVCFIALGIVVSVHGAASAGRLEARQVSSQKCCNEIPQGRRAKCEVMMTL